MGAKSHICCLFSVYFHHNFKKNGAKSNHFACFQPILLFFSADLLMEYRMFISIVDISTNLKNIDIDIDKTIIKNIDIDIDIDMEVLENIDNDKEILENIDIDMENLRNINIDKILNRLEFGISNRASWY